MRTALCTLVLNEIEWLTKLYEQHRDWSGLIKWVFVESADVLYAETNPDRVSPRGLSVDGTTEFLAELAKRDDRIVHIPYGFCRGREREHAKCEARQQYLTTLEPVRPDILIVLDADEFYARGDQEGINRACKALPGHRAYLFPQRHLWYPPSLCSPDATDLGDRTKREVVGGYWSIPHYRVWRWERGLRYLTNHNWIEDRSGTLLTRRPLRADKKKDLRRLTISHLSVPQCVHTGFASSLISRKAKHAYYIARGEGVTDRRSMYVECRTAFENWREGDVLPHGAKVIPYTGPIPEVFLTSTTRNGTATSPDSPDELLPSPEHAASHPLVAAAVSPLSHRRRR